MDIKYFCAWWGLNHLGLEGMVKKIKAAGFDGIECFIPKEKTEKEKLKSLLNQYELELIAHQYEADGDFEAYCIAFDDSLRNAAEAKPLFINSHTGRDYWPFEQNERLIEIALQVEEDTGVKIIHETHRGRFLFAAMVAYQYFQRNPNLRINADFSHWVCVSESMLHGQEAALLAALQRAEHIHARVGHEEGPQVPDPRLEAWQPHLFRFTEWWQWIVDRFKQEGRAYLSITPEFGPAPYTVVSPKDGEPISDFFEINCWMKDYLKETLIV